MTNFDTEHLTRLVDAGVPVVSNQVQYSIIDRRPQHGLADYCQSKGIALLTYGSVGGGLLSERFLGAPAPGPGQLTTPSLRMYSASAARFGGWGLVQELLVAMDGVAKRHGVTVASVALRYVLEQKAVGAALVGVRNGLHVQDNLQAFSFRLGPQDYADLNAVLDRSKGPLGDVYGYERGYV